MDMVHAENGALAAPREISRSLVAVAAVKASLVNYFTERQNDAAFCYEEYSSANRMTNTKPS